MLSSFGSRLKDYVFENQGVETEDMIQREVIASLHTWEPRIDDIQVSFQREDAVLLLTITYVCRPKRPERFFTIPVTAGE